MILHVNIKRILGQRDPMIYGHFIEHFHRQIYGGIYDPGNVLSDEDGLRTDVLEAMRRIKVPVLRWPGGCFVSSYHWKDAVGEKRKPFFDKAWRVEDPNTFGTDEYVKMCRKIGCEPYICTNAGTGTAEEMSDWVEYCNLEDAGWYAKQRIANGYTKPHKVKFWSVGNENYGAWEIGAKSAEGWGRLVVEASKMIKHVDPEVELTAAALTDLDWNINLLKTSGQFLDWISIHKYWDAAHEHNNLADYETVMAFTNHTGDSIQQVRGLLMAMRLEKKIRIAFDEWNLRGWCHPNVHTIRQGVTKDEYLKPRDQNDDNSKYTMADAVFSACFLNECNRNCDIVGMANFAPIVNARGCIFTYENGIVLRTTYHVFDLYVNYLGDIILDSWNEGMERLTVKNSVSHETESTESLDILATRFSDREGTAVALVNKHPTEWQEVILDIDGEGEAVLFCLSGESTESYNDIGREEVRIESENLNFYRPGMCISLKPHSVNVLQIGVK